MSNVYFIGDLHFGHKKIAPQIRPQFQSVEEHDDFLCAKWKEKIKKQKDIIYVLGDVAFTRDGLERFRSLPGRKFLVRGNHDVFCTQRYLVFFEDVLGIQKLKLKPYGTFWLSHCPIHPQELRGGRNIHGHVHTNTVTCYEEAVCGIGMYGEYVVDPRYINVSAEAIGYEPKTIDELIGTTPEMAEQPETRILA